jgi:hypothetical protein
MIYFPHTNEYLLEARGRERATSSNKYRNTCGRQRRGRGERGGGGEEEREDNYQVIRIRDDTSKTVYPKNYRRNGFFRSYHLALIVGRFCPTTTQKEAQFKAIIY